MPPRFTIVIPVYNEAAFAPRAVPQLLAELDQTGIDHMVLVVENGSTDGTAEAVTLAAGERALKVISLPEADYGAAMRHGFLAATGEWVVNFDIDYFSGAFLQQVMGLEGRADLVIASKRDPFSEDRRSLLRRVATAVFNRLLRLLFRSGVTDTHGMKAFRHSIVAELAPQVVSRGDLFDTELVLRAERAGYRIVEVPVVVEEMRSTRLSLLRRVPRTLVGLWRIRRLLGRRPGDATP